MHYVYALIDPITNKPKYVGVTKHTLSFRLKSHMQAKDNGMKAHWIKKLKSKGLKPKIILLEIVGGLAHPGTSEKFWIRHYENSGEYLFNINNC